MNHREILGVSPQANQADIQRAFRETAQKIHPDHNASPEATAKFMQLKEARDALLDEILARPEVAFQQAQVNRSVKAAAAAAFSQAKPRKTNLTVAVSQKTKKTRLTARQIKHEQELDRLAGQSSRLGRTKESAEVRRHRKSLRTARQRLSGKY